MPTMISHPAVPLALAGIGGRKNISIRLFSASVIASILPDIDTIGMAFGIPYSHWLGHRGFFHSIAFALIIGSLGMIFGGWFRRSRFAAGSILFLSAFSHGLLDAMTNGGLGVAFFSPFSNVRYFFPVHPIVVSPLSLNRFLTPRGISVLQSELLWIWVPCITSMLAGRMISRNRLSQQPGPAPP